MLYHQQKHYIVLYCNNCYLYLTGYTTERFWAGLLSERARHSQGRHILYRRNCRLPEHRWFRYRVRKRGRIRCRRGGGILKQWKWQV